MLDPFFNLINTKGGNDLSATRKTREVLWRHFRIFHSILRNFTRPSPRADQKIDVGNTRTSYSRQRTGDASAEYSLCRESLKSCNSREFPGLCYYLLTITVCRIASELLTLCNDATRTLSRADWACNIQTMAGKLERRLDSLISLSLCVSLLYIILLQYIIILRL